MSDDLKLDLRVRIELMSVQDIGAATHLYQQCFAAAPWGEAYSDKEVVSRYLSHYAQSLYDAWTVVPPLEISVRPQPTPFAAPSDAAQAGASTVAQSAVASVPASPVAASGAGSSPSLTYRGLVPFFAFVARVEGEIVALCCGCLKPWMEGMHATLDEFCVSPMYQGRGVGRAFLQGVEQILTKHGVNAVITVTDPMYQGGHFYRKCGYIPVPKQAALTKILA